MPQTLKKSLIALHFAHILFAVLTHLNAAVVPFGPL